MPPSSIKLTYFHAKARGETIRWVLKLAGAEFEDNRIEFGSWHEFKPKTPTKALPMLEVDGVQIGQSGAIAMYLAREYNLLGSNNIEAAVCHMIWDSVNETMNKFFTVFFCNDKAKKAELQKEYQDHLAQLISILKPMLAGGRQWLVGEKVSLADLVVAFYLSDCDSDSQACDPDLEALTNRVRNLPAIKKWIEERPAKRT